MLWSTLTSIVTLRKTALYAAAESDIYVCVNVCMYIYIHVYIYIDVYTCIDVLVDPNLNCNPPQDGPLRGGRVRYIYICICMYVCMYVYIYTCVYI